MAVASYEVRKKLTSSGTWDAPIEAGAVLTYQFTGLDDNTSYDFQVRAKDAAGNYSDWSVEATAVTDAFVISAVPSSYTVAPNAAFQFEVVSPITGAVWTLEGDGALDQSGNYTAPNTSGNARVRYHSPMWASFASAYIDKLDDDRLEVTDGGAYYWNGATTNGKMTSAGDWIEFTVPIGNVYVMMFQGGGEYLMDGGGGLSDELREHIPPAPNVSITAPALTAGDVVRAEFNGSKQLIYSINGTPVYTTVGSFTADLEFFVSLPMPLNTVIELPRFGGSGISGYTEYVADITIS